MIHISNRRSLHYQHGAFTDLVFYTVVFLALMNSCRAQSEVIVPSQPVVSLVGEDVILPCHLDPVMNAFDMTVEWARPDLNPRFILVWRHGEELKTKKHPSFSGRTSVFIDELEKGNISLKLSKVKVSDEGGYKCFLPTLSKTSTVQLVVGSVSSPVVQMTKNNNGVLLECESADWYPEPEMFWLDGEGNLLSAEPTETVRGPDGLYTVSSRVTVEKRHGRKFTCRVTQRKINQTREKHLTIPDHFFVVPTPSPPSPPGTHVVIGAVIGCAALLFIPVIIFVVWRQRQKKFKNKKTRREDGSEHSEEEKLVTSKSDKTRFQVVNEGEKEKLPLISVKEEENNADKTEEKSETEDEIVTEPEPVKDIVSAAGKREMKETDLPVILKEEETNQEQEQGQRRETNDGDESEQETVKPVRDDSGLSIQIKHINTDQKLEREETQKEAVSEEDEKETKTEKERPKMDYREEQTNKGVSGSTGQKKQKEKGIKLKADRESKEKLQSEMKKRKPKDDMMINQQRGIQDQPLLEDRKQERSQTEPEDRGKRKQEENQSTLTKTTEEKAGDTYKGADSNENQEEVMETQSKYQRLREERIRRAAERRKTSTKPGGRVTEELKVKGREGRDEGSETDEGAEIETRRKKENIQTGFREGGAEGQEALQEDEDGETDKPQHDTWRIKPLQTQSREAHLQRLKRYLDEEEGDVSMESEEET
ncbi:golgin subfamily A member 6-like protein 22 [Labrus bergylta]|uniref:golgin subfamily A member 6-like protein 22 n=1 Tax=Labrus bergylta TaxID=56723 RepID=UPI0033140E28